MNIIIYIAICSTFTLLIYFKFIIAELEKIANNLENELKNIKNELKNIKNENGILNNEIKELNSRLDDREIEIDKKIEAKLENYRKREMIRRSGIIMD